MAKKRSKQLQIPGTEPEHFPELDEAAEEYVERRDARMAMGKRETEAQDELVKLMHDHGLKNYEYDGLTVILVNKEKAKVRRKDAEEDDDDA